MDNKAVGLMLAIMIGLLGVIVSVAAIGGIMFVTDTAIGATVVDKDCSSNPFGSSSLVTVNTRFPVPGIEHTLRNFDNGICSGLSAGANGNYAEYHLKSERTVVYEREGGACLYDSSGVLCAD